MNKDPTALEKMALLGLAALSIGALSVIAVLALMSTRSSPIDPNAAGLIGVIAAGLIAFGKDIVAAIRAYSMSAQLGKVTDQLAASGPVVNPLPTNPAAPQQVEVVNDAANPVPVDGKLGD